MSGPVPDRGAPDLAAALDRVAAVADAVLYEGYLLYPYRGTAAKNQARARWQFGVLVPPGYAEAGTGEHDSARTECLLEPDPDRAARATLHVRVRFLQAQARIVQRAEPGGRFVSVDALRVAGVDAVTWDEAVERQVDAAVGVADLVAEARTVPFTLPGGQDVAELRELSGELRGRVVRQRHPLSGELRLSAEPVPAARELLRIRAEVANTSPWRDSRAGRDEALRHSLIAAHTALAATGGGFLSLLDPPGWAGDAARACVNRNAWPVLGGPPGCRDVVLSAPIVLYDHPTVASESPGDLFDATEIDELLVLRTLTLTDEEKRQARATDARAAEILDRVESMPPEVMRRLHGTGRVPRVSSPTGPAVPDPRAAGTGPPPWWDPVADAAVRPEANSVLVDGVEVRRGSRVRLRPTGGSDAQDMFVAGRTATVHAVFLDCDDEHYLAVTLDDDPAGEIARANGRFRYFAPDEVEPIPAGEHGEVSR
ncbi:hypothetical protein [Gandjariella thermophila]|uniref:Uncharacterized protein n=1 Tax=Gandjariella thermophila TaxID=1931992 RepID=A0A4D4J1U6_9PSEU|nr:hypothetical protein [Gandjariella thermophila]GDY28758.1 hypothetical protein GTS_03910 [Gandjariella thermophila]